MDLEEVARKYALKNAVEYDGESNPGAVIGKVINETGEQPDKVGKVAGKICGEVNRLSLEEQRQELEDYEFEEEEHEHDPLPDLMNAEEGEVVVRFAPNPNGPPHIGSARGMAVNGELKNKYNGTLVLRFDDTDPRNKRPLKTKECNAYEMYKEDYEWMGYKVDKVVYSSQQFDKYIEHAEELIEMGKAYVSKASPEKMQKYRKEGTASKYRNQTPEENMALWNQMKNGDLEEGEAVLKIKTDLDHKNPAVRDWVAFRIIENPDHPITGNKYRVWPLLDFAGAIEDHYTETTHIVRGKDLRASTKRQKYIYDYLGWTYPEVRYWGTVKIAGFEAPMSTSTLAEMIENGELDGWDDPRVGTVRALRRRGFQPEALREFFIEMGVTENTVDASLETLESYNQDIVEDSNRYFFVRDPVKLEIEEVPKDLEPEIDKHPDYPDRGFRRPSLERENGKTIVYIESSDLDEGFLRLKGLCNVEIKDGKAYYREGDHRVALDKGADIVHWVSKYEEAEVLMPNGEKFEGLLEPSDISMDEVVQFERFGFVRYEGDNRFIYGHE